jgi:hypothetical protein
MQVFSTISMVHLKIRKVKGSSFLLPAHGKGGARATIKSTTPPPEKFCPSAKQAGKKEGGLGEGIFARLLCRAKRGCGVGSGSSLRQQRGKARKNCFLN